MNVNLFYFRRIKNQAKFFCDEHKNATNLFTAVKHLFGKLIELCKFVKCKKTSSGRDVASNATGKVKA